MQLSMALKGKEVRNEILYELTHTWIIHTAGYKIR
jgi:hypothetical protein